MEIEETWIIIIKNISLDSNIKFSEWLVSVCGIKKKHDAERWIV